MSASLLSSPRSKTWPAAAGGVLTTDETERSGHMAVGTVGPRKNPIARRALALINAVPRYSSHSLWTLRAEPPKTKKPKNPALAGLSESG